MMIYLQKSNESEQPIRRQALARKIKVRMTVENYHFGLARLSVWWFGGNQIAQTTPKSPFFSRISDLHFWNGYLEATGTKPEWEISRR